MQLVGSGNELGGIHGFKKLCAHFVAHMLQDLIAAVFLSNCQMTRLVVAGYSQERGQFRWVAATLKEICSRRHLRGVYSDQFFKSQRASHRFNRLIRGTRLD